MVSTDWLHYLLLLLPWAPMRCREVETSVLCRPTASHASFSQEPSLLEESGAPLLGLGVEARENKLPPKLGLPGTQTAISHKLPYISTIA
jgi:hypothetical protein